jgi:alpha-L-fucosidase
MNGNAWIPAECDVSIRPGWFYHKAEDSKVKIPEQLFELYLKSVGRGANLLLNVPPDGRGLITKYDSAALVGFKKIKDQAFQNNLILGSSAIIANTDMRIRAEQVVDGNHETSIVFDEKYFRLTLSFKKPEKINCIVLREAIKYGQKASEFSLIAYNDSSRVNIKGTTIGRKRILTFKTLTASVITLIIPKKAWPVKLGEIEAYLIDENLVEK